MRFVVKKIAVISSLLLISACSMHYGSNGETLYLASRNGPNLVVPAPLTDTDISHFYELPNQNQPATVSIVPPTN